MAIKNLPAGLRRTGNRKEAFNQVRESSNGVESHYIFHCDSSIVIVGGVIVIVIDIVVVVDNKVGHILNQFRNYIGFHKVERLLCIRR